MNLGTLSTLSAEARDEIRAAARLRSYASNGVVYFQEDPSAHFFIVQRGYVRLSYVTEDGFVSLFAILPAGHCLGECGAIDGMGYSETASASGAADVLAVDASLLRRDGPVGDEIRKALSEIMTARYRDHIRMVQSLHLPSLQQRLAHSVLRLLDTLGNSVTYKGRSVDCLGPVVTQRDLGSMVRGTRENVNKALRKWEKDGIIALEDRHILLLDKERLRDVSLVLD